ncbi:DMT family transporter [Nocardia sp. NBC_01730]|uniref:DMT family transporter n=1 Tax=Nocardia sp. NBC_01730 TaxID=2975998 RepID=UPI002E15D183|nr:DMT family transporter [Nocardia sp. NBC_01730]
MIRSSRSRHCSTSRNAGFKQLKQVLGLVLAALSGVVLAAQSRINGELGARLGDGVLTALISFFGGLPFLVAAMLVVPHARAGLARLGAAMRISQLRIWHCLGGFAGAIMVASQGIAVGLLGVAVFSVGVVAGQTVSSLLVDRAGLGPGAPRPVTAPRLLGAALTLLSVAVVMWYQIKGHTAVWLLFLPLLSGGVIAVQQAINGRVRVAADSVLVATLLNFLTGTVLLLPVCLLVWALRGAPAHFPQEPWLYLGGPAGIFFIAIAAVVVGWTGVLAFGLGTIAGQLLGAVLLDILVPIQDVRPQIPAVAAAVVALTAAGVATLPGSRNERASTRRAAPASDPCSSSCSMSFSWSTSPNGFSSSSTYPGIKLRYLSRLPRGRVRGTGTCFSPGEPRQR